jgi:hypothetical protein
MIALAREALPTAFEHAARARNPTATATRNPPIRDNALIDGSS